MADPDTFRVSPSLQGLPGVSAPGVESQAPAMLIRAGQAITKAAGVGADIFQRELRELNATRATEGLQSLAEFQHELTYSEWGWARQQGGNAVNRERPLDEDFGVQFDEKVEQISLTLGNEAQRRLFTERAREQAVNLRGRIQAHAAQEGVKYQTGVLTGGLEAGQRRLGQALDPADQLNERNNIAGLAGRLADMQGMAPDEKVNFIVEQLTPGHLSVISRMMSSEDVEGALAYAQTHREEITQDAWNRVEPVMLEQQNMNFIAAEGAAMWAGFQGNNAAAIENVQTPIPGAMTVTSGFGPRNGRNHEGVDIRARAGTPVMAGVSGIASIKSDPEGWGTYVEVKAADGHVFRYAHLGGADIQDGDRVVSGQQIGRSGGRPGSPGAGNSRGEHLHYEVIGPNGEPLDPEAFHRSRPTINPEGAPAEERFPALIEAVNARTDLSERQKKMLRDDLRERESLYRDAQRFRQEDIVNSAWAKVTQGGGFTAADRAALAGSGQAREIVAIQSYVEARAERAAGGTVSEDQSLEAYGRTVMAIANGEVTSVDQVLRVAPFMSDSLAKQLMDDLAGQPQGARDRAERTIKLLNEEVAASGAFVDDDGKKNEARFQQFVGSVESELRGKESALGRRLNLEEERSVVTGMLGQQIISGRATRNFDVRRLYDNIPSRARINATRALQRRNQPASQANIVRVWNQLTDAQRQAYGAE